MVKVFYDQDSLYDDFAKKLREHSKVYYSKKWDAYLVKEEDYDSVFNELEFDKQCELDTDDLLDWDNIKIMKLNEMIDVQYEQEYVTVLNRDFDYLSIAYVEDDNEEVLNDICESEDWGIEVEGIVNTAMAICISSELSDEIKELKEKGFDIVIY